MENYSQKLKHKGQPTAEPQHLTVSWGKLAVTKAGANISFVCCRESESDAPTASAGQGSAQSKFKEDHRRGCA